MQSAARRSIFQLVAQHSSFLLSLLSCLWLIPHYRQGSSPSNIHSPLVSHQEVPLSRILQNSRSTGSLLKGNAECVVGMRSPLKLNSSRHGSDG
ncbi:hypothetical protein BKA70DRAFT_115528 [Coprinopsis sp. MPI-PUGE-AT-0042]|nr:hypothetical protein BKA70DRAFT_115528 [Coprinopsis sp. MPI-PUGE-AT-0042]